MAKRRTTVHDSVRDILQHVAPLPPEAGTPQRHYEKTSRNLETLLAYTERKFFQPGSHRAVAQGYLDEVGRMVLLHLIENFERFLKEIAAVCVDCVAPFVLDDRFNAFRILGSSLAAHFGTDTLGRSLCESILWLDTDEINSCFRKLLADPYEDGTFILFPKAERENLETLGLVWQLRHTMVHNVSVITRSDAIKLRLLARRPVETPRLLTPTRADLRSLKRFLDDMAAQSNERIGKRLAELLSTIHAGNPILFAPQEMANRLAALFGIPITVGTASAPPP